MAVGQCHVHERVSSSGQANPFRGLSRRRGGQVPMQPEHRDECTDSSFNQADLMGAIETTERHQVAGCSCPRSVPENQSDRGEAAQKDMILLAAMELPLHASEDDAWVRLGDKVYDITQFLGVHPGGREVLLEHLGGSDVAPVMAGRHERGAHAHSATAYQTLEHYCIGRLAEAGPEPSSAAPQRPCSDEGSFQVDPHQPLVFQVGHLGPRYSAWVHQPVVSKAHPRFFKSDILEFLSITPWQAVPVVWLPVVALLQLAAHRAGLSAPQQAACLGAGLLLWTLVEYSLHRFLFHQKTSRYWTNTVHFLLHGVHHKHPLDSYRLVFPPALTIIFVALFWPLFRLCLPYGPCCGTFGGTLLGYICYDLTHYYLHHGTSGWALPRQLKRHHLSHHFKYTENGFGITSTLWDHIFSSQLPG